MSTTVLESPLAATPFDIPIFPLSTVLFPGGVLPLRLFEARYLDMARACLRNESPFGVCLLTRGSEVGSPAEHESVGCLAEIRAWDMVQTGILQVRTVGTQRFRIIDRNVQADGLIRARVEGLADDPKAPVPGELQICGLLARKLVADIESGEPDPGKRMIEPPYALDEAGWIANRLIEFLPMPAAFKQALMVVSDPIGRLDQVHRYLETHQVI